MALFLPLPVALSLFVLLASTLRLVVSEPRTDLVGATRDGAAIAAAIVLGAIAVVVEDVGPVAVEAAVAAVAITFVESVVVPPSRASRQPTFLVVSISHVFLPL
jgi:hypothetical protein